MAERPIPTSAPESSPLHERGRLTTEHWQFIAQKLPRKYKIKKFAKAILDGTIDEEDSDQYLGKRHWRELDVYFYRHTIGFIPEMTVGYESRYKTLAKEIMNFARLKEKATEVSIDDKLAEALEESTQVGPGEMNFIGNWYWGREETGWYWSRLKRGWYQRYITDTWEEREYGPDYGYRDVTKVKYTRDWLGKHTQDTSILTNRFLLQPDTDIRKIKHKSPGALVRLVRSQREAVTKRTGLRWEKPIPQAT